MLSVWLPFDGNIKNQGFSDVTVSSTTNITFVDGKIGKCLSGTSTDYETGAVVTVPNLANMISSGEKFTVACWVRIKETDSNGKLAHFGSASYGLEWSHGYSWTGYAWFENRVGAMLRLSGDNPDYSAWHHIAVSGDKSGETYIWKYYIDGEETQSTLTVYSSGDDSPPVGNDITFQTTYYELNDFRFYSGEILSDKQIKKLAQGLVMRVPLTAEGYSYASIPQSGLEVAHDISGYQHNGIRSGVTFSNNAPRLPVSTGFDGNASMIRFDNLNLTHLLTTAWTICFWIYSTDAVGDSCYFSSSNLPSGVFCIRRSSSYIEIDTYEYLLRGSTTIPIDNEWTFLAITYDGVNIYAYVNCQNEYSIPVTFDATEWPTMTTYYIGRDQNTGNNAYEGLMSDFRIYATALSADDIMGIYTGDL